MFKSIKECMKNWILSHERAYWYLVFGIAIGLFALITAIGVGKVYNAEAAEIEPMVVIDGISIPDIRTFDWSEYAEHFETEYGYTGNIGEKIVREHKYCIITVNPYLWENKNPYFTYLFTNEPIQYSENSNYWLLADWDTSFAFEYRYGEIKDTRGYGLNNWDGTQLGYGPDLIPFVVGSKNSSCITIASTYDFRNGQLSYHKSYQQISYPEKVLDNYYDTSAPYVMFDSLNINNVVHDVDCRMGSLENIYDHYYKRSTWTYKGQMKDISSDDISYSLIATFRVEIPSWEYCWNVLCDMGLSAPSGADLEYTRAIDFIWSDPNADFTTYEFTYPIDIDVLGNGMFDFTFTFQELETLVKYFNPNFLELMKEESKSHQAFIMSCMHIERCSFVVETTRSDSIVRGAITTNKFERGVYDSCFEVITLADTESVDKDVVEDLINKELQYQYDEYQKWLEDYVDELEQQLGSVGSVNGAFGNLEGSDLWSGFISLVSGLGSLAPAIASLSSLTGAVFGFLPVTITGIMSTTLFAICIIAIIKAIRG